MMRVIDLAEKTITMFAIAIPFIPLIWLSDKWNKFWDTEIKLK